MKELDKAALGRRIRQIRSSAGLRQWELARLLGTTQSAVHKYEHGVVPEPRRLVELARIGGTSIEWILTGQHWENGSEDQARLDPEILRTARSLSDLGAPERDSVDVAIRILREAADAVSGALPPASEAELTGAVASLRDHGEETASLLATAHRIQQAVLAWIARSTAERLTASPLPTDPTAPEGEETYRRQR